MHVRTVATSKVIQQHVESDGGMMCGLATVWMEAVVVCFEVLCQRLSPAGIETTQKSQTDGLCARFRNLEL